VYQPRFSMRTPDEGRSPSEEAAARTAAYQAAIDMVAWGESNGNLEDNRWVNPGLVLIRRALQVGKAHVQVGDL
jgi:hypothetical protein